MPTPNSLWFLLTFCLGSVCADGIPALHYSVPVLKAIHDHVKVRRLNFLVPESLGLLTLIVTQTLGDKLREKDKDTLILFYVEPFESDIFTHGTPSAYPPDRSRTILPSGFMVSWNDKSLDQYMYDSIRSLSASILEAEIKDGQDLKDAAIYPNYALYGTPLEKMYGKNVERLREIKKKYDPFHVMDLTGGFKL
jgi:hypothetical protein